MSEVMHDHRIDDAAIRPGASGPACLSVREVLVHVWRLQSHLPFRVAPMIDAVDACVQLGKPLVYGAVHRFEHFSSDFATWVVFWGPPGGERE